jgi:hypothetical protein
MGGRRRRAGDTLVKLMTADERELRARVAAKPVTGLEIDP